MYVKANYLGLHENLMDLTHFLFTHGKWNIVKPEHILDRPVLKEQDDMIVQEEVHENAEPPAERMEKLGMTGPFTMFVSQTVKIPGLHQGLTRTTDNSNPPKQDVQHIIHILTPETANTMHYLWAIAYDAVLHDDTFANTMQQVGAAVFEEDKVVLEDIEEVYRRDHRPDFREKIIRTDKGGIQLLRMFSRMAAAEQESALVP
ncbi:hypothetical protein RLDS_14095 [Sphingobium lactosutens DS20]|uniref:Vanillate O-demethylase oxygenase-like C-terminal catalytic domain-containing protein n=2 Tax=Sphingobium TaxID=165695 RepID=T0IWG5_9SPHN|nr:hypothetical protein RLDS_14095 [Sphingobium lactosutens DS20]